MQNSSSANMYCILSLDYCYYLLAILVWNLLILRSLYFFFPFIFTICFKHLPKVSIIHILKKNQCGCSTVGCFVYEIIDIVIMMTTYTHTRAHACTHFWGNPFRGAVSINIKFSACFS